VTEGSGLKEASKDLFFEKKKQKTFDTSGRAGGEI
jgi:hypothetical protein